MNDNFLKEIGRSYIVSSLLPSALFVSLAGIIFRGFAPRSLVLGFTDQTILFGKEWIFGLIIIFWVAFYLFSSVDWTVKLFEGYFIPSRFREVFKKLFRSIHYENASPNYRKFVRLLKKKERTKREDKILPEIRRKAIAELQNLELISPIDDKHLLPTRLGNVLRASEVYAFERYCIEGITIWPRLFNVLPTHFAKNLEEKNNHLLFLLNSSLLVYVNATLCIIVSICGFIYQQINNINFGVTTLIDQQNFFIRGFSYILPIEYALLGIVFAGFAYSLYSVGVNAAEDYALFIRSGFDLYRMDLLKQLRQPLPASLSDEKQTWLLITEYFIAGNRLGAFEIDLAYTHHDGGQATTSVANLESDNH